MDADVDDKSLMPNGASVDTSRAVPTPDCHQGHWELTIRVSTRMILPTVVTIKRNEELDFMILWVKNNEYARAKSADFFEKGWLATW